MFAFLARSARFAAVGSLFFAIAAFPAANQAPVATLTSPASGSVFNAPATITLAANATDSDGTVARVEFYRGTTLIGSDTTSPYSFVWSNVAAGTYSVTAKAFDNLNKVGTSAAITIQVINITTVITSPAAGAVVSGNSVPVLGTFTGPDTTTVIVTAGGGHSTVATSSAGSFSANVALAPGPNTIEVQVARRDGTTEVESRSVTAVAAPVVVMTAPTNFGPHIVPAPITLAADAASAQGTIQQIEFFEGSTSLGIVATPPYSKSHTLTTVGSHPIFARATDSFGFTADSVPVVLTAQSQPPVVQITSPTAGASFRAPATIALTATASDPDGTVSQVQYFRDGIAIGSPATNPPYAVTWGNVPVGPYLLTAQARDNTAMTGDSASVSITVVSNVPPTVNLTAPAGSVSFREPASVSFSATAGDSDGTVSKVEFLLNDVVVGTVTAPPYAFTKTDVAAGSYVAKARATDNDNAVATASTTASVTVTANALPTVALTSPANGATFDAPANISLAATASDSDGSISKVEFFAGPTLQGTVTAPPYAMTWANAPLGAHTLTAKATDNDGGTKVSVTVGITVNGITAAITAPANGASFVAPAAFDLVATSSTSSGNITSMEFYDGATRIYTASIPPGFATANYTLTMSAVAAGTHGYTMKAFDNGGRTATSSVVTVTVAPPPTPPSVALTAPQANAFHITPATIRLSADATAGSNPLSSVEFYSGVSPIGTVTAPPYSLYWAGVPAGEYSLTAKAIDTGGGSMTSAPVMTSVGALTIAIDSPANGASLTGSSVLVSGTVQASQNSGVTVNGRVAPIDASNRFYTHLPILAGNNDITATVTTASGQTATHTITVASDGLVPIVEISAGPLEGIAPLTTTFTVANGGANDVTLQVNGSTTGTIPAGQSASFPVTVSDPASLPVTVTATDAQNNVTSRNFVLVAADPVQVDQMLRAIWGGMTDALASGDKTTALSYLDSASQEKYGPVFDALLSDMATIVGSFSTPVAGTLSVDFAEFIVNRLVNGEDQAFFVYMLRGKDGVWRTEGM